MKNLGLWTSRGKYENCPGSFGIPTMLLKMDYNHEEYPEQMAPACKSVFHAYNQNLIHEAAALTFPFTVAATCVIQLLLWAPTITSYIPSITLKGDNYTLLSLADHGVSQGYTLVNPNIYYVVEMTVHKPYPPVNIAGDIYHFIVNLLPQ